MRGRGLPRWWALLLEMFSMCTCYSPCVHAIAGCIREGLGTCHLLIAQRGHLWFLHVLGFYWTTCHFHVVPHVSFSTSTRVVLLLDPVSLLHWTTCHIFIDPRVHFLFDHVSLCCPSTCHIFIHPCGLMISFHVSDF